jgi:hypothetical protein
LLRIAKYHIKTQYFYNQFLNIFKTSSILFINRTYIKIMAAKPKKIGEVYGSALLINIDGKFPSPLSGEL